MRVTGTVALFLAGLSAVGCCKKPIDDTPSADAASGVATTTATPTSPKPPKIGDRAQAASRTEDDKHWIASFKFKLPESAPVGGAWIEAREACRVAGLDLCTEDQWALACKTEPDVAKAASFTISFASGTKWVTRGGTDCSTRGEADEKEKVDGAIGLCCERRASISSPARNAGVLKEADVYLRMVEDALNAKTATPIVNLLADPAELFGTTRDHEDAQKALSSTYVSWPEMDSRFVHCDVSIGSGKGNFECLTVMTRFRKSQQGREISVFSQRYEYGPPGQKYSIFGKTAGFTRKWGPM